MIAWSQNDKLESHYPIEQRTPMSPGLPRYFTSKVIVSKPLNVLFFGSDHFSVHSLNALASLKHNDAIDRIQVVTRSAKSCGRYMKEVRDQPIVRASELLALDKVIRCDSTADMLALRNIAPQFDLIVAVSFGKLIPQQLITDIAHSLNVHPSLLPRYRGASPIQYALLNQDMVTGVTVQTLHPTKFDHGNIVAQTAPLNIQELLRRGKINHFEEDVPEKVQILMDQLGIEGGNLLAYTIKNGLYTNPPSIPPHQYEPSLAPKITTDMRRARWQTDTVSKLLAKHYAFGTLHAFKTVLPKRNRNPEQKRILFQNFHLHSYLPTQQMQDSNSLKEPGSFIYDEMHNRIIIQLTDGQIACSTIQFQGFKPETPSKFMNHYSKRCGKLVDQKFE
ncbi:methionyl-tRNA formyltransferase Ecym_1432 [Eremothecium cymbalariae DBVPG|uniref:Methionyl-tRNA formyltransferase, mitochondrial n=1 Tax=Eremothecium cymbalariae (strain CBS 270.75 / DBVPG 7215 / KCTC 17166 / NRRL Y-17582) TaxID=931890 RepID=G8JM88_ERECY|nr:hypothetical protein Ecym_1432 [Eremothecium cymbalariae DBVPG\